jgi:SAM-dependent methyltransferase
VYGQTRKIAAPLPLKRPVCEAADVAHQTPPGFPGDGAPHDPDPPRVDPSQPADPAPHRNYWDRRSEVVYRTAARYCEHADVLDAGCYNGAGSIVLGTATAVRVAALDRDTWALRTLHGTRSDSTRSDGTGNVGTGNVGTRGDGRPVPVRGELSALPFADEVFDTIVGQGVLDRLTAQTRFVRECHRALTPVGTLVLSTRNQVAPRPTGTDGGEESPGRSGTRAGELLELLDAWFNVIRLLGLRHGPRITAWEEEHGSLTHAQRRTDPRYWPRHLRELVRSLTADDFVISPVDLDQAEDLVVVALRR